MLTAGTWLGPYEVLGQIGSGGMGEVYKGRDPRLGREVAIKILPAQFSADSERLRRFEQEARAAGMLNHPNILTIYDIGNENGSLYVVSELLQGETLRERLGGVALSPRKAIEYSLQIAHGLAAAHEKGIVHRDLKPENLFITKDGRVKILDFGLAKLTEPAVAGPEQSKMQTIDPGTQPGMVLGTVGYMSPEQIRGRLADHRSDIFAFGTILYEMLSGKRAFHRDSTADTMSAILKEDPPDLSQTNRNIPPALERIVRHCLEKSAEERFQSARDLAFDLEMISGVSGSSTSAIIQPAVPEKRMKREVVAAAAILIALVAGFLAGRLLKPAAQKSTVASAPTYHRLTFRRGYLTKARFTPDGQTMIYSAAWGGNPVEVFSTRPQSPVSRSLGFGDADLLSISSSGEMAILLQPRYFLGWQKRGTLARVPIDGGAPRSVLENVQDADWKPEGNELAVIHILDNGPYVLESPIGKILYRSNGWLSDIRVSPHGDLIAFMEHPTLGDDRGSIAFIDKSGKKKTLTPVWASETGLAWNRDGSEIWFTGSDVGSNQQPLFAVTLAGKLRTVAGIAGNLFIHDIGKNGDVLLAQDSRRREVIGLTPGDKKERDLSWFDWTNPRDLTDDGKWLLFEEEGAGGGPNYTVYLRNTDGSPATKLGEGYAIALSPDRKSAISVLPGTTDEFWILPTGPGQSRKFKLPEINLSFLPIQWFRDGERTILSGNQPGRPIRSIIYNIKSNKIKHITPEGTFALLLSPDEKSILAQKQNAFYQYSIEGQELKKLTVLQADDRPIRWNADGKSLFVRKTDVIPLPVYLVDLATGRRSLWKEMNPPDPAGIYNISNLLITPDGKSYIYSYRRTLSDLYLAKGLR